MNAAISDLQLHCCCAYTNFYLIIMYKISQRLSAAKSFRHKTTDKCEAKSGKRVHSEPRDLMGLPYPLHSYFFLCSQSLHEFLQIDYDLIFLAMLYPGSKQYSELEGKNPTPDPVQATLRITPCA